VVDLLRREVYALLRFVAACQPVLFVDDRHQCVVTLETDATPVNLGVYLRVPAAAINAVSRWRGEHLAGVTVPTTWRDVGLDNVPVGVTELAALVYWLDAVAGDPELRPLFQRVRIEVGVDNIEALTCANMWVAKGAYMQPKWELLVVLSDVLSELGSRLRVYHVPTAVNRSDVPTRSARYHDVRLLPYVFEDIAGWVRALLGRDLTHDFMSSENCRQRVRPGDVPLPYIGQQGDPGATWHDLFAQPLSEWEGCVGYLNPPHVIAEHAIRFVLGHRCTVVVLVPAFAEPAPGWMRHLRARAVASLEISAPHSEARVGAGFLSGSFRVLSQGQGRVAYLVHPS
jgi:hypothetical protein